MKKRIISLFLALALCVGMLPAPAWAEEPTDPTQAVEVVGAANPSEETDPTTEPTEAKTEPTEEETEPTEEETEPTEETAAPGEDEAVAAVQAMIDALPDVSHMSESYLDALEAAYSAFDALSETQQAQITGVEKLEALFGWVNSQVSTLAEDVMEISGEKTWENQTFTNPVKLIGHTTLTLVGDNKIECDAPLDLNDYNLTIKGTGSLTVIGNGRSKEYQCNGAIFDSTYTGSTASAGTLILESGTVKASGGTHNAISLYAVDLKGGSLEAYGGVRSGLACSYLYARSGSIYATGGKYGIYAAVYRGACNPGNLPILASDEREAQKAEMDEGNLDDINDNAYKKTYYIGDVTGPMLSIKAQQGYLYEGLDDQKVTFAISRKNISGYQVETSWVDDHQGLNCFRKPASVLNVTANATVKQGTYYVKFEVVDYSGTEAKVVLTKTVTVTVLGAPITITAQPKDASVSCKDGNPGAWQGDKEIQVTAKLAAGLTEDITYQWKLEDDTPLDGFTQSTIELADLYSANKLTQQADKAWLHSAKVYCTLTVGSYNVDTDPVTLTVNTCAHERANPNGNCKNCGEPCSSDPLLVRKDGIHYAVQDTSGNGAAQVGVNLVVGGTFYLTKDVIHRSLDATYTPAGDKDVILDLQGHTLASLDMGNFPVGSITLKNGTLNQCVNSNAEGKLILDGVTITGSPQITNYNFLEITVQGDSVFQENISFNTALYKPVHLRGGTFKKGIDTSNGAQPLALLDDDFAYKDSDGGIVDASIPENLSGEIQVVAHTCKYVNGKCACGRTCDHETVDADGYCTFCHALVVPYAIGQTRYKSLEAALDAANAGDTITLRGNFYQGSKTVEINKSVTLDLGGHTLTSDADGKPVLRVLAENVTIRNGTVQNTRTAKSSPAVTVGKTGAAVKAGLTVKDVTFIGSSDGNAPQEDALDIQNGHAKVESGIFSGGIFAQGDLTMTGGSTTRLELGYVRGKVELSGGSFDSIHFDADADYAALLADGYAYQSGGVLVKLAVMNDSTAVQIVKCTHPDGLTADTACPYCGKKCGHGNISQTTGLCPECGYQMAASLTVNGTTTFFNTFRDAAAEANGKNGALLTLLKDEVMDNNDQLILERGEITIDWNGHTLSGQPDRIDSVITLYGAQLTLHDSSGKNAGGIYNRNVEAIDVSRGSLTIESGTYACRVRIPVGTATVKIRGGIFKNDGAPFYKYAIDTEDSRYLAELMAPGYTLALDSEGRELYDVYANKKTPKHTNVYVVPHASHTFDESGKCACGAAAPIQVEAGTESFYFGDFESAVNQAMALPGPTVRLRDNVTLSGNSGIYIEGGTFTIDWNGHTLSGSPQTDLMVITGSANVILKDSSGTNAGGARHTDLGAAVSIAVGSEGSVNIQGGTYSPSVTRSERCYGSVQISGGVFENAEGLGRSCALYDYDKSRPLSGMLVDGTAFAYKADGSELLNAYHVHQSENYRTVYAVAHTHKFHEDGKCACGYTCLHEDVTVNGDVYACRNCGLTMTVMVETADGISYTTNLVGARNNAENGTTVKLLKNANLGNDKEYAISGTLDLNGKELAGTLHCKKGSNLQIVNRGSDMSKMGKLEVWNGAKVTIADTAGSIFFDMVTVESGSVADLLPEGGAYFRTDMRTWISAAEAATKQTLGSVVVREAPVKSVTLTANKTSVPYGESQTVTLSASATLSEGETASYAWAEVKSDGTVQTFPEQVGTSFTLPEGVNAGEHTYRVSVTAGDYTLSKDIQITVTKAKGILENKDYPTEFTYGQTVPTPEAENFTSNHPDGTFSYRWLIGDGSIILDAGENPTYAGTYMLYATWTGGTNYNTASLSLPVTIQKAAQTANISVVNETISGKGDGGVTLLPSAKGYEIREKSETTFEPISASQGQTFMTLTPGVTYEIRLAETENYQSTAPQEVTVQPGRKLKVTLPTNQEGYTLTASKTQLDWHEDVTLTFQLDSVGAYKAADFGIWAEAGSEKTKLTLGNDGAVKLTAPENDITITVTGVKTDNVAPQASIRGRLRKDSGYYVKWEGFQENPADDFVNGDFVISATDRVSGVADFWYYLSDKPLTLEELKGMNGAFWARPANQGKVSITEDGVYYLYAKALDKANNAGYACTGKLVKESNPPTFSGVKDGETYYVSQQLEIHDDGVPDWYMAKGSIGVVPNGGNENPIKLRLKNDGRPYTFTVGDRCGNEATITVYMKPLTDLTQPLYSILEGSIQKTDRVTLDEVEATLKGLDVTYATEPEKKEINDALARIAQLRQVLYQVAEVEAQIDALPDSVEPYQQTVEDRKIKPARKAYSDLTDHQKTLVDSTKLDKLVRLEAQLNAWTITEGDGQTWFKGSGKPLSFTVNGQSRKVIGVRLENGNMLGKAMLTVSDSIDAPFTIALRPEYLQCREPGEHSFAVIYRGGTTGDVTEDVTFTVEIPANYLDVTGREEFEGKTTVTVDGKEYPIEEMNGTRYVNLPETGDLLTIYSFKDGTPAGSYTNYPTGMQVFRITRQEGGAKAEEITEFANLLKYAGCSIRLTGTKGIRMITGISENARTALIGAQGLAGYTLEEYGTVVMRGVGTPTLENSNSHNFAYKKGKADPVFARAGGMIQYTNVLVGFSLEDCKDMLTLRPYIKLKDTTTGETVTLYGGCVSRSIGYIARQNANTYQPGTAGYKYVHEIIDAVYGKTEQGGETK